MGWLLDTNVLSHLSPAEQRPNADFVKWLNFHQSDLWLSGVTIFEISNGINKLTRTGATQKASRLKSWLDQVLAVYRSRIIVPDIEIMVRAGALAQIAVGSGVDPGIEDALIAATGEVRNLVILTRNMKHLKAMKIACHNPFVILPPNSDH